MTNDWVQFISIGTNLTIILVGVKLVRLVSRMELKVDTMWGVFVRRFGTRTESHEEGEE